MTARLQFEVRGIPVPYSLKGGGNIHTTPALKAWKLRVKEACEAAIDAGGWVQLSGVPVRLEVEFFLLRRGRPKKGAAADWPIQKPDHLSLLRPVEDAMTQAGAWDDDCQVVDSRDRKWWAAAGAEASPAAGLVGVRIWCSEV